MKSNLRKIYHLLLSLLGTIGVLLAGVRSVEAVTLQDITKGCPYGAAYKFVWDGWEGHLGLGNPNDSVLWTSSRTYKVRYSLHNAQDYIAGYRAPGYRDTPTSGTYRIVFWVDFNNTPSNPNDDQRFDGYVMTQTKNALAGVTWSQNKPFGFYAIYENCVIG